MPIEFLVVINQRTFPKTQELPEVYEDLSFNGNRDLYLTSPLRIKVKVNIVKNRGGPIILKGDNWEKFAVNNFKMNVKVLHFVEEGDNSFYVTGYYENGREAVGYDDVDIRNRFPRFMAEVKPSAGLFAQTLNGDFVEKRPANNHIKIKANWVTYNVKLIHGKFGNSNQYEYKIHDDSWKKIKHALRLKAGMRVVFTKKRSDKYWLTAFYDDGQCSTIVHFHGAIKLRNVQPNLTYWEKADDRMRHRCQWLWHRDHFGEHVDTFYKEFAKIQDHQRLAIPSSFLEKRPMHMYSKALMKHEGHEELMTVKMDFHSEKPDRTNHVNVKGNWKEFAKKCKFAYDKLIRFKFMYMEFDENAEDDEPQRYPVFHLC